MPTDTPSTPAPPDPWREAAFKAAVEIVSSDVDLDAGIIYGTHADLRARLERAEAEAQRAVRVAECLIAERRLEASHLHSEMVASLDSVDATNAALAAYRAAKAAGAGEAKA